MFNQNKSDLAELLSTAVDQVLSRYESGSSLSDSMAKVASDLRMNPDQITRVCHLINRGKMNERLDTDTLGQKLAEVEVLDPALIISRVYGISPGRKTASAPVPQYPLAQSLLNTPAASPADAKRAAASPLRSSPAAQPRADKIAGMFHGLNAEQIVEEERKLERRVETAKFAAKRSAVSVKTAWIALVEDLRRLPKIKQASVVDQMRYHFEERDPERLLTLHAAMDEALPHDVKLAIKPEVPDAWEDQLFGAQGLVQKVTRFDALAREHNETIKEASHVICDAQARLDYLRQLTVDGQVTNVNFAPGLTALEYDERLVKQAADKHAVVVGGFMGSLLGSTAGSTAPKSVAPGVGPTDVDKFILQIRQPQHEAALSAISARPNLQELIQSDDVISSYDPKSVLSAFNELSQYSPRSTESLAVLRSALRQMLQNHASIFDLQQVRSTERVSPGKQHAL